MSKFTKKLGEIVISVDTVSEPITPEEERFLETETSPMETGSTSKLLEKYKEKKTKEDLFTRQTYMIRDDLIKRFNKAAATRRKGFKTEVINELLETFLNENHL